MPRTRSLITLRAISVVPPADGGHLAHQEVGPAVAMTPSSSVQAPASPPAISKAMVLDPGRDHTGEQPADGGRLVGHGAGPQPVGEAVLQRLGGQLEHPGLADQVLDLGVVGPSGAAGDLEHRRAAHAAVGLTGRDGDVGGVVEHALVEHPADADGPAVVHLTDPVVVRHLHVGHELLAELLRPVQHLDPVDLDAGLADREHEDGEAPVLRHVPVGPGEAEPPVRPPGAGRPDLRAVEHPLVAVAYGGGLGAGDVRSAAGLREELHPELLAPQDRREVPELLLLGPELEDDRGAG